MVFKDRQEAGERFADKLKSFKGDSGVVVFGILRGGIVVAEAVAKKLSLPFSGIVVRKIGAPGNPELAIGAVSGEGVVFWDEEIISDLRISRREREELLKEKEREREERERLLGIKIPDMEGKIAIVVDDGVATGSTAIAAGMFFKKKRAKKVVLATPVIAKDRVSYMEKYFDEVVYVDAPEFFYAVGQFYRDFPQVSDEEARNLLKSK
ncbi:phosphoribosyltransferase [Candidatus Parcubacteria bacterium]|nr:MAG: phosphoribosyltransferase [Candidatus Parcubacteria bacterium]